MELAAADCGVAEEQYADVAIYFLRGDLQEVMKVRRGVYLKHAYDSKKVPTGRRFWVWKDFKEDLRRVVGELLVSRSLAGFGWIILTGFNFVVEAAKSMFEFQVSLRLYQECNSPGVVVIRSSTGSNMASDAIDLLIRRAHPYVASSVTLGLIIGGTAVLLPALGMMTWDRMRAAQQQRVGSGSV